MSGTDWYGVRDRLEEAEHLAAEYDARSTDVLASETLVDERAEIVMEQLAELVERITEGRAVAQRKVARVEAWLAANVGPLEDRKGLLEEWLREWAADWRARNPDVAVWSCVDGTVKTTHYAEQWTWPSDKDLLAVLESVADGRFIRETTKTTQSPDKAALKKAAEVKDGQVVVDGELVAGVTVAPWLKVEIDIDIASKEGDATVNAPARCSFRLVGVTFAPGYPNTVAAITAAIVHGPVSARLRRDADNPHDPNAIAVECDIAGGHVGHMPRNVAARYAPSMDAGTVYDAEIADLMIHPDHPDNPGVEVRIVARTNA